MRDFNNLETLIISDSKTLDREKWEIIEENLLDYHPDYLKWHKETWKHYQKILNETEFESRPYQPVFAALYCLRHRNIVGLSLGGGKTIITGLAIAAIYDPKFSKKGQVHILVPNNLCAGRWLQDLEKIESLRGRFEYVRSTKQLKQTKASILIYSQDLPKYKKKGQSSNVKFIKKRLTPSLMVIDEVHNLKPNTQRTKVLEQIRLKSKRTIALSGTLSDGDITVIPHLCKFVYQSFFPFDPKQFISMFGVNQKVQTNYKGSGSEEEGRYLKQLDLYALPKYYDLMRRFVHRVTLDDPQVKPYVRRPEGKEKIIKIDPNQNQVDRHREFIKRHSNQLQQISEGEIESETVLTLIHPLIRIANAFENSPKLDKTKEEVENTNQQVCIFVTWNDCARTLHGHLLEGGIKAKRIYAYDEQTSPPKMTGDERGKILQSFIENPQIKVCILPIGLASESIDLQNVGKIIFYDLPWSSLKVEQAIARSVRPGNPRDSVEVIFPYTKGLIDEHQLNLIQTKLKISSLLFDYRAIETEEEVQPKTDLIKNLING